METQELSTPSLAYAIDYWKPDVARFQRELEDARATGLGDPLTLAEMECSLDLIDADLCALNAAQSRDHRTERSRTEAQRLRGTLAKLIEEMRPFCRD
jgi:hypothetical protein